MTTALDGTEVTKVFKLDPSLDKLAEFPDFKRPDHIIELSNVHKQIIASQIQVAQSTPGYHQQKANQTTL